jgi:hypothetical protein
MFVRTRLRGKKIYWGYALHSSCVNWLIFRGALAAADCVGRDGAEIDGLLDQPQEQQAARRGFAAVEAESVLVQVIVDVRNADRSLVRAEQPSLQRDATRLASGNGFSPTSALERTIAP